MNVEVIFYFVFFNLNKKTCWIRKRFEQLSTSIGWRVMALQKPGQKSGRRGTYRVKLPLIVLFKLLVIVLHS